jgi:glycine dehydrogenase subunit 1
MNYFSLTENSVKEMLDKLGLLSTEVLFKDIPENLRIGKLNIPEEKTEFECEKHFNDNIGKNNILTLFTGNGIYNHYIPSIIDFISSRSEFFTAYTPYQSEISQGSLKIIFEYQTNMSRLTGMDISNASIYDGASATAEAVIMALKANKNRKKNKVLLSGSVSYNYRRVVNTYLKYQNAEIIEIESGLTLDLQINEKLFEETCCVVLQYPNKFGIFEDYETFIKTFKKYNITIILVTYPMVCGLFKTPGELGADIVCGDAQCFGIPMNGGGSYLGFLCTKNEFMRKIPGRLVGKTKDKNDNDAYVLTLQAREQHIKRAKATSNICSNQSLNAIRANIYLSLLGSAGLNKLTKYIYNLTHSFYESLTNQFGNDIILSNTFFFNEFLIKIKEPYKFIKFMIEKYKILPGIEVKVNNVSYLMVCVTEKLLTSDFKNYLKGLKEYAEK